jgi:hypothetical protein
VVISITAAVWRARRLGTVTLDLRAGVSQACAPLGEAAGVTDEWDGDEDEEDDDSDVGRWDESVRDEGRAPICPHCGVTALPADTANVLDATFVCDNADCDAFGQPV